MVDGRIRRLPMWMIVDDADKKKKKTMAEPKQNSTLSTTSNKCRSKAKKSNKNVLRTRFEKKRKAKHARDADADSESGTDTDLTVDDLVSIAQEYLKAGEDSVPKQSFNRICPTIEYSTITNSPCNETAVNSTSQHSSINVSRTENPAQDMLDLFLGPLLKKPQLLEDESRTNFFKKDMDLTYELRKQTENDVSHEMEIGTLTKKKSSLKHKVSLLLD